MRKNESSIDKQELLQHINGLGPQGLLRVLGIRFKGETGGTAKILCPWHEEKTPSCSISKGGSGDVIAKCFGCGETADALKIIARVLDLEGQSFPALLQHSSEVTGFKGAKSWDGTIVQAEIKHEEPKYPPIEEVRMLWAAADGPASMISEAMDAWADMTDDMRILLDSAERQLDLEWWPFRRGHMVAKMFDAWGNWRSVQGRITGAEASEGYQKQCFPRGYNSNGLFFADEGGLEILRGERLLRRKPRLVWLCEGLTDSCSEMFHCSRRRREGRPVAPWARGWDSAVIGIVSGSEKWLSAIDWPRKNVRYLISVDNDEAGRKYADAIEAALPREAMVGRIYLQRDEQHRQQWQQEQEKKAL